LRGEGTNKYWDHQILAVPISITVHCSLFTIHYLVLSQVATVSGVTARVASGATTALVLGSLQKRPRDPID